MNYYQKNKNRIWQIDFARGIAVIAMVALNAVILFSFFGLIDFNVTPLIFPSIVTASIFIFLAGISLVLSYRKHKSLKHNIMRGAKIFVYGLTVTAVSLFVASNYAILFGILHLIGLSIIISSLFIKFKRFNVFIGTMIIVVGFIFQDIIINNPLLVWLGIKFVGFQTLDYFPLFPWLGIMLIGIAIANIFISAKKKTKAPKDYLAPICFLGRKSLLIYFLHVIIILAIVGILNYL